MAYHAKERVLKPAIALRIRYAISGIDLGGAAARLESRAVRYRRRTCYAFATRCPALTQDILRICYAVSGTDESYYHAKER
eukprot:2398867-Rhodomonas_salina.1